MLTAGEFESIVDNFLSFNRYPAVAYKVLKDLRRLDYHSPELTALRPDFLASDIVRELAEAQNRDGLWGALLSKDYGAANKFPTTSVAVSRCLYIGLTKEDGDVLFLALDALEDLYRVGYTDPRYEKNERAPSAYQYSLAGLIEAIAPYNPLVDDCYERWLYVASEAFADGGYSCEREAAAQLELFNIRGPRLGVIPLSFVLSRKERLPEGLEQAMLHHYGRGVYEHGGMWSWPNPTHLPERFENDKTRRLFRSTDQLNMYRRNRPYMEEVVEWLLAGRNTDGLWDYGPQAKDPWGYFEYLSTTREHRYNRIMNCTMEVLIILKGYLGSNSD